MGLTALIFLTVIARPFLRTPQSLFTTISHSGRIRADGESPQSYYDRGETLMLSGSLGDAQKGLSLLEISATRGYSKAACELAAYYRWMHPNDAELARWMRPCAEERPTADRETVMADLYLEGRGVPLSASDAARWYERAATHGGTEAERSLFYMYRDGKGDVRPDKALAMRYAMTLTTHIPADQNAVAYLLEQGRQGYSKAQAWSREWKNRLS